MLETALPQPAACAQRIGKIAGGGVLAQSVLTIPAFVSWNDIVPADATVPSPLPRSAVVHASTKDAPAWLFTVTFSVVSFGAYTLSDQPHVQVASSGCGNHLSAAEAVDAKRSAATRQPASALPLTRATLVECRRDYETENDTTAAFLRMPLASIV